MASPVAKTVRYRLIPASAARPSATLSRFSRSTKKVSAGNRNCHVWFVSTLRFANAAQKSNGCCVAHRATATVQPMLDIRLIREKPDFVRERLATRGGDDAARIDELLKVDAERRKTETELQQLQADRNRLSKEIGAKKSKGDATKDLESQVKTIGDKIVDLEKQATSFDEHQRTLLLEIPNLPHESVPLGKDPSANKVVREWGKKPKLAGKVLDHVALGEKLKILDLERATKLSGSGFICFTD